jgi:hypothetical protein
MQTAGGPESSRRRRERDVEIPQQFGLSEDFAVRFGRIRRMSLRRSTITDRFQRTRTMPLLLPNFSNAGTASVSAPALPPTLAGLPSPAVNPATTAGLFGALRGLATAQVMQALHDTVDEIASPMTIVEVAERYRDLPREAPGSLGIRDAIGLSVEVATSGMRISANGADFAAVSLGLLPEGELLRRANAAGHRAVNEAAVRIPAAGSNLMAWLDGTRNPVTGLPYPSPSPNPPHLQQQLNCLAEPIANGWYVQPPNIRFVDV